MANPRELNYWKYLCSLIALPIRTFGILSAAVKA
jgi:hypothetical protein